LRDLLGEFRARALLILDEAHHAAPASGARYAIDSQITKAAREIARRLEHRLFLTATPHNGHSNSFSALLEILDPQRFTRAVPVEPAERDKIMVRRLKADLRALGESFPERVVEPIVIDGLPEHAPELELALRRAGFPFDEAERQQVADVAAFAIDPQDAAFARDPAWQDAFDDLRAAAAVGASGRTSGAGACRRGPSHSSRRWSLMAVMPTTWSRFIWSTGWCAACWDGF
jgi:hypothetical protein